ncbi:MAG: PAS domain S-box protein, partial [Acidobacteria bacterium]
GHEPLARHDERGARSLRVAGLGERLGVHEAHERLALLQLAHRLQDVHGLACGGLGAARRAAGEPDAPEDRQRVAANLAANTESVVEHSLLRSDGTRILVEAHGRPVAPNSRRRYTAIRDISERRRMESALELAARKSSIMFDTTSDGIWLHDLEGQILEVNDAYLRMSGYDRDELVGMRIQSLEANETPDDIARHISALMQSGGHDRFESRHRRKDGTIFDVDITALHLGIEGGRIAIFVRDNTDRKRTVRELNRLAQHRQLALNAARMGWWHYDPLTGVATYDGRYTEIFGVAGHQQPNDEILKLLHPDDLPRVWAAVEAALDPANPKPYSTEYRVNRPDGSMRWVEAHGVAVFEGEGGDSRATSFVGTVADITERKGAESRLAYLASFPERNPNPVVEADRDGRVRYANSAAKRLFPTLEQEGAAHPLFSGWPAAVRALEQAHGGTHARDGPVGDTWFRQTLQYVQALDVVRVYGVDVTEHRRAEDALRESEARLRLAQVSAGAGLWDWDIPARRLEWSEELFQLFGVDRRASDASLDIWRSVLHPDDRLFAEQRSEAAIRDRVALASEYRVVLPSGEVRWISALGNTIYDSNGQPLRMTGICLDITERKQAEEALRASEARFRALAEALPQIVWTAAADGSVQWFNRRWYEYTGGGPG